VVGAELAVSVMLSSLVRRGICPNFVVTRGVFSCPFEPPADQWGSALNKRPTGDSYSSPKTKRRLKEPKRRGRYQYIRMELCDEGDAEEFLKRQPDEALSHTQARHILFQVSFALHAAADRFSLKHYDMKLLNVFLQRIPTDKSGDVVLRYGLGEHIFCLRAPKETALYAKIADYGTANVDSTSNGQGVTIAQFTTLENTPPEFLIMGNKARQGHGHDCFGLGLCMLHLFTGHAPYEEILGEVSCPSNLKNQLRKIWENDVEKEYSVIRGIVLADVYKDEDGHIIEGEPDEVLYDTLYRFLVLFGVPDEASWSTKSKVISVVRDTLTPDGRRGKGRAAKRAHSDANKFGRDRRKYSLSHGTNQFISRARCALNSMDGGMDLLLSLVHFNPLRRATALDVLNSAFMKPLRDISTDPHYSESDEVLSYTTFSTFRK
jgi:serine/threonine protein kinase